MTTVGARLGTWQAEVYAAEHEALSGRGRRWRRVRDAQEYVDALVASPWFTGRWPHFVRCAVERRGSGSVYSTNAVLDRRTVDGAPTEGAVLMADGSLCQEVLLHELAHLLAPPDSGHGPEFLAVQTELVRGEMGFYAFVEYREALARRRHRTDCAP